MSEILIRCPQTGRATPTGLTTDMVAFETLLPIVLPLRCPAGGQVHRWLPDDAWIADHPKIVRCA